MRMTQGRMGIRKRGSWCFTTDRPRMGSAEDISVREKTFLTSGLCLQSL